jgi:hypothetical protein
VDKKDIIYIVSALALVLIIALVIKPIVTGQPVNTGIPLTTTPTRLEVTTLYPQPGNGTYAIVSTLATPAPATLITTAPTWNPAAAQTVVFIDPAAYGLSSNESGPIGTRINTSTVVDTNMTTFATIASSSGSGGTTNIMYIPFPYWELEYTVEPASELTQSTFAVTPTRGSGIAMSGVSGSYSTVKPEFSIQVMDGDDPNRIVRTITPPGGINLDLWTGVKGPTDIYPTRTSRYASVEATPEVTPVDPRPWTEKFYEGQRNYYFVITAKSLTSYSLKIKVPTRYIGKY